MIGIYSIKNKINNHEYIGQSRNIQERWRIHRSRCVQVDSHEYNYPLYKAIRKYGLDAFEFSVLEECSISDLSKRELYWIKKNKPVYNQTIEGTVNINNNKLTPVQVKEIQIALQTIPNISHTELAEKYHVHRNTIRDINVGRSWVDESFVYPLHETSYFHRAAEKKFCIHCGKEISNGSTTGLCVTCSNKTKAKSVIMIDKKSNEILKTFSSITEAIKYLHVNSGSNISQVCRGKRKTAYGYKWKYC